MAGKNEKEKTLREQLKEVTGQLEFTELGPSPEEQLLRRRQRLASIAEEQLGSAPTRDVYRARYDDIVAAAADSGVDKDQFNRFAVRQGLTAPSADAPKAEEPKAFFNEKAASDYQAKANAARKTGFSGLAGLYEMQADRNIGGNLGERGTRGTPIASMETRLKRIATGLRRRARMRGERQSPIAEMADELAFADMVGEEKAARMRNMLSQYGQFKEDQAVEAQVRAAENRRRRLEDDLARDEKRRNRNNRDA